MGKVGKVYYSISEVAELTGLEAHVLRYWETEFPSLKPIKNRGGNRAYREKDIKLLFLIKKLLYHDRFTIEGARRQIVKASDAYLEQLDLDLAEVEAFDLLRSVREELREIAGMIEELPGDVVQPAGKRQSTKGEASSDSGSRTQAGE
jgi:DNA-binding transcriptional MerR regulator